MTTTYHSPRPRPADPRAPRPAPVGSIRQTLGNALPDGYTWAHRPTLTVIHGGDPTTPGPDEIQARDRMIHAIRRWGVSA
ncbi:hypothetical protein OG978_32655 [Streptomyces sp. NBC_01591]|uniref:hypothetical protein n=1 Tax=Streptomyces sp. NBC_01591 TaxID=2975888 RepID=UPI002DD81C50|nr:hypothetical protein [Streptomyces sp. NBC_01591]WSD71725.1 hypothetical protein OG978_32655 [Streptomyces sp. NBC_01591]